MICQGIYLYNYSGVDKSNLRHIFDIHPKDQPINHDEDLSEISNLTGY